jgi:ribosomal-protein-alanine N-acetyltransferase
VAVLRDYRSQDFDVLWRIDQQCFQEGIAYSRRELAAYMNRSKAFTLVAESELSGGIIGFVVAESDPSGLGHVLTLDVSPSEQRRGVGSLLLNAAESKLLQLACKAVLLETAINNAAAVGFYKRHGYAVVETIPRYYLDNLDALVMGKHLVARSKPKTAKVKKT